MASSFNGVTIEVLGEDGQPRDAGADITDRHIPGGNLTYIDIAGTLLPTLNLTLYFPTGSAAVAFEAQRSVMGTLIVPDGTFTALLRSTHRINRAIGINGATKVGVVFTLL